MSTETINRLADEAMQRLGYALNRSAGQHTRAMKSLWSKYHE